MNLRFIPEADEELDEASRYYDAISKTLGDTFIAELKSTIRRITTFPNAWPRVSRDVRRCLTGTFPYQLIYRVEVDEIVIYAVAHQSRRPGYWRKRIGGRKQ